MESPQNKKDYLFVLDDAFVAHYQTIQNKMCAISFPVLVERMLEEAGYKIVPIENKENE